MNLSKIQSNLSQLIYDPVKGRILYDLIISFITSILIYLTLWIFYTTSVNIVLPIIYSIIFLFVNYILGLYGKFRTSTFKIKSIIILISNFISYFILLIIFREPLILTLIFVICSITTLLPRFFLNFNVDRIIIDKNKSNSKKNPVLVVGGGGYIGSILVEKLLLSGEKVRVFDKFIYSKKVFKNMKNVKNLEIFEGDISDIYSLTLAIKDSKAIIHLAGIVGDPASRIDEDLTRHVNIASTKLLKETAKAFGVKKFIFASSCSVYGAANKIQNEKSKPNPISLYAKTKIDSEKELLSDRADNFYPIVLRFATVFGHSRKPRFDLVANLFVAQALSTKVIKVYGGEQWRPFIHVNDVAEAIIKTLNASEKITGRQIFNVGDDKMNFTISQIANIVKETIGDPKIKILISNKNKDNRNYRVSFKKIQNEIGFNSSITMEKGLKEIYKNFINNKYNKNYNDPYYINFEITKGLKKEFKSKKYRSSHFTTIS